MSNLIDDAIRKGYDKTNISCLKKHSWRDFEDNAKGKRVFIYGAGKGLSYLSCYYPDKILAEGVIDKKHENIELKTGHFNADVENTAYDLPFCSIHELEKLDSDEFVVLITGLKNYESIIKDLQSLEISSYYVLLFMEINNPEREKGDLIAQLQINYKKSVQDKIKNNKIVAYYNYYGGHAKYITEQLLLMRDDLDIVWLVNDLSIQCPQGVRKVPIYNWKKYIYEMHTAKIWLFDNMVPDFIDKKANQIYIQLKHWASITLKGFYLTDKPMAKKNPCFVENIKRNAKIMDYCFIGSEFDRKSCEEGFDIHSGFIDVGSPRTDAVFNKNLRAEVLTRIGVSTNKKIAIICPTYRLDECMGEKIVSLHFDMNRLRSVLSRNFGGEWQLLLRLHPLIAQQGKRLATEDYITDVSLYPDSQELVSASDIMITDYSSIMFEMAFVGRPVFLYAYDKDFYVDDRGLLMEYDSLPFPISTNEDDLEKNILDFDKDKYARDVKTFLDSYGVHEDGHASERAAEFIINLIEEKSR